MSANIQIGDDDHISQCFNALIASTNNTEHNK